MTGSVAGELIRTGHLVRGLRTPPLIVGAVAVGVVLALHHVGVAVAGVGSLRVVGLILVLGSGFALDDAAAPTLQASPYPLARRIGLLIGFATTIVVPWWTLAAVRLLPSVSASGPNGRWSLGAGLTIELMAALAVVWATAAWGRRRGLDEPGLATAPVLLGLAFLAAMHPRVRLFVGPGPQWLAAHLRWAAVLVCAAGLLALAMRDVTAPVVRHRRGAGTRLRGRGRRPR